MYAWIGLGLNLGTKRWGWVDGSRLNHSAWACGGPTDVFSDLGGAALPVAVMSNGGPLRGSCASQQQPNQTGPPSARGTSASNSRGLWTNDGFSLGGGGNCPGAPAAYPSCLPHYAFGRFMTAIRPPGWWNDYEHAACDLSGRTDYTGGTRVRFQLPAMNCLYSAAFTYVCKVPIA